MTLVTHVEESSQVAFICSGPLRSQLVSGPLLSQSLSLLKPFTTFVDSSGPCPAICPPITIRTPTIEATAPSTVMAVASGFRQTPFPEHSGHRQHQCSQQDGDRHRNQYLGEVPRQPDDAPQQSSHQDRSPRPCGGNLQAARHDGVHLSCVVGRDGRVGWRRLLGSSRARVIIDG